MSHDTNGSSQMTESDTTSSRLAREAGGVEVVPGEFAMSVADLARFEALVRADEREKAAKLCEAERLEDPCKGEDEAYELAITHCIAAIRSSGGR